MSWNPGGGGAPPAEFEDLLYGALDADSDVGAEYEIDDVDLEEVFEMNLDEDNNNDIENDNEGVDNVNMEPPLFNMRSPEDDTDVDRPSRQITPPILIVVPPSGEDEMAVEEDAVYMPDVHALYQPPQQEDAVYVPDVHALYQPPQQQQPATRRPGRGRPRGRGGISRGGRRRSGRVARSASTREHVWRAGEPLIQVCVTDDDVPAPLRLMVYDLVRKRQLQEEARAARVERLHQRRQVEAQQPEQEEEFEDADDGQDDMLLGDVSTSFNWVPMDHFVPQKETYTPTHTGSVENYTDIYEAFRSYWDDGILNDIATETNRYAASIETPYFRKYWVNTNMHEILALFAFWMMLGIIRMPTIKSCFSTNPLLATEVFRKIFTIKRYAFLCRALHFADNTSRPEGASRLYCFGRVLTHLNEKFASNYIPGPNISIDESLTLWKGLLIFRQYIKTKAARFGIKTFELCDAVTGYLWKFQLYTGRDTNAAAPSTLLKSTAVVLDLIRPLLNKGHCLFMDNWFNSPALARFLKRQKTDCVGTLRSVRRGVPPLLQVAELEKGQYIARNSGDMCIMAWQDKKKIMTISTCHGVELGSVITGRGNHRSEHYKPQVVLDYNKYMGGVDRKDQMLEPYLMERKRCKKLYLKMFKRLLNCSILNSKILLESSTGRKEDHLACRLRLVEAILAKHLSLTPASPLYRGYSQPILAEQTNNVHWPVPVSGNVERGDERRARARCTLCYKQGRKNSRTPVKCERCQTPLCVIGCFKQFHESNQASGTAQ